MSRTVSAALALGLLCGCSLVRVTEPALSGDTAPMHGDRAAIWQVGVSEPELRSGKGEPEASLERIQAAGNLIFTLRQIDLFHEVDFTHQLRCPIDLELVATPVVDEIQSTPLLLQLLTLSVKRDEHVAIGFHAAGAAAEAIELRYDTGEWVGVLPLLLSPFALFGAAGDWRLVDVGPSKTRVFRAQLLAQGGVLESQIGKPAGGCPETK